METNEKHPKCVDCRLDCFAAVNIYYAIGSCQCRILNARNANCHFYKTKFEYDMEIPHQEGESNEV